MGKKKGRRKKAAWKERIAAVGGRIIGFLADLYALGNGLFGGGMSWKQFVVFTVATRIGFLFLAVWFVIKLYRYLAGCREKCDTLYQSSRSQKDVNEKSEDGFAAQLYGYKYKTRNKIKKLMKQTVSWGITLLVLCLLTWGFNQEHHHDLKQYASEFKQEIVSMWNKDEGEIQNTGDQSEDEQNVISDSKNENPTETDEVTADDGEGDTSFTEIEKPKGYRFVLDEPNRKPQLDRKVLEMVYFSEAGTKTGLKNRVESFFDDCTQWKESCDDLKMLVDAAGNDFYTYTDEEDAFLKQIENASGSSDYITWCTKAPHSSQLDSYINGRETLIYAAENKGCGCWELWWHLANDYQLYAQEYEIQTNNDEAVFYYYTMSVYCAMKAVQYKTTEGQYADMCNYIKIRFQDIKQDKLDIEDAYKERAEQIYNELDHYFAQEQVR